MGIQFEGPMNKSVLPFTSTLEDDHTAGFRGIRVDVYKLIHATENQPTVEVPVADHLAELEGKCWADELGGRVSPRKVIDCYKEEKLLIKEASDRYPNLAKHFYRIMETDLNHPVLIYQGQIVDGMHRFAKAVIQEDLTIKAKIIEFIPAEVEIPTEEK